ncbi:unnamed protein product [Lymnaea stagnalis]|uniref:PDZ domain-containing protein n=1 Tax=Lymnaea stagnalis TaxID=6523 RepID=A0AAV2IK59_LYMST
MVSAERIQVTLQGGAPWGFRLSGGGSLPLTINKIRKKSQAHINGLQEGDAVISINGVHVHDKSQDEALELVEQAGDALTLEIFRGDIDDLSREKPKKAILVPGGGQSTTTEETSQRLVMTSSVDNVTSDSFDTAESDLRQGGFRLTTSTVETSGVVNENFGSTFSTSTSSGLNLTATVDDVSSSTNNFHPLESSPVISAQVGAVTSSDFTGEVHDVQSSSSLSTITAQPFVDSSIVVESPTLISPMPPRNSPQCPSNNSPAPPSASPQPPQIYSPAPPSVSPVPPSPTQSYSPAQATINLKPTLIYAPAPPPVSPKPTKAVSNPPPPVSPKPPGVTSTTTYATFDDGQTQQEVSREHHVQKSDDGGTTTVVQRETTRTTSILGPSYNAKNQAFNVVQSNEVGEAKRSTSFSTTATSTLSSATVIDKKGPTPFTNPVSSDAQLPPFQFQPTAISGSLSTGNLVGSAPVFKPTKFVPGSRKKDIPGPFSPTSSIGDTKDFLRGGKENALPPPMFQKIVSDKTNGKARDMWRPNVWPSDQHTAREEQAMTPTDEVSPYATLPFTKRPGRSLVEEQKRKLLQSQISTTSKTDHEDFYHESQESPHHSHHRHERLHVFAPPVEIHADSGFNDAPYSPYDDQGMDDDDDGASSQDSSVIRRRRKLYGDSAFYDTPGKSYPTITDQMKLCKIIAQSLTSAANRRARGAKMFMKRKRKSTKWVHEGHSEWSSSAGDVANLQELDSELSPDEGGNKPLLYFKIPSLKSRINSDAKQTKMALTPEQFEKLRLNSQKCDHKALPPDTCFGIVADLKAHKGRGGRMFEKRKQRSDKFVIDELNAKFVPPKPKIANPVKPLRQEKTPWEAAMENAGNVDAAFSSLTEWEKNQRLNLGSGAPGVDLAPLPAVRSTLRSDESPHLLKGTNFNRTARGWAGGGEYPVAEQLHPVAFAKSHGPLQPAQQVSIQTSVNQRSLQDLGDNGFNVKPSQVLQQGKFTPKKPEVWQPMRQEGVRQNAHLVENQDMRQARQVFENQTPRQGWPSVENQAPRQSYQGFENQASRQSHRGFESQAPRQNLQSFENQTPRQSRQGFQNQAFSQNQAPRQNRQGSENQSPRPKSWHPGNNKVPNQGTDLDYSYTPVDYNFGTRGYPTVAYMQPIIPGTDL